MPRKRPLRPAPLAFLLAGALPILAACGGRVVSLGTNGSQLASVDPTTVSGSCNACPVGYAHPNVCCQTSPNAPASCGAYVEHPFQACEAGWSTFPNPLTCCNLKDDKDCIDTPSDAGIPTPPPVGCGYACPPGYYVPTGANNGPTQGECCTTGPDGTPQCFGWATASPGVSSGGTGGPDQPPCVEPVDAGTPGCACACPVNDPNCVCDCDGGAAPDADTDASAPPPPVPVDAGCAPPPPPPPPPTDGGYYGQCGECPDGWKADPSAPDLCCTIDPNGIEECFSQATGPVSGPPKPPEPADAGTPTNPPMSCYGSASPVPEDGGKAPSPSCGCTEELQGHKDNIDCSADSSGATTCFCTQDGQSVMQFTATGICDQSDQLQAAMGKCFPIGL